MIISSTVHEIWLIAEAYLGGHWAMAPLNLAKKYFFYIEKKLENLVGPLGCLCMSTSSQRKFGSPFPKS